MADANNIVVVAVRKNLLIHSHAFKMRVSAFLVYYVYGMCAKRFFYHFQIHEIIHSNGNFSILSLYHPKKTKKAVSITVLRVKFCRNLP